MINFGLQIINFKEKFLYKDFLINKALPIGSATFFLIVKLFFNFLLWHGRLLLPNPGDAFGYTRWIRLISESKYVLVSGYTAYSFILGNIAKVFSLSPDVAFQLSFWLGIPLLTIILWKLFKALKFGPLETALCFVLLAFYTGNGAFHGFYWVVPTFFCVALFFYLFATLISQEKTNWFLIVLAAILMPLIHGIGIFICSIFGFYLFFKLFFDFIQQKNIIFVFKNNLSLIKKTLIITLICIISYIGVGVLLKTINNDSPQENDKIMMSSDIFTDSRIISGSMNTEKSEESFKFLYLNKIAPHWLFGIIWVFIFFILFQYKQYQILLLFFSTLIFCIISSFIHYKGFRSLVVLWPITYVLVGYSIYFIWKFIKEKIFIKAVFKNIILGIFVIVVVIFYIFNIFYSFWYIDVMNRYRNFNYNPQMFDALLINYQPSDANIYVGDEFMKAMFLNAAHERYYNIILLPTISYKDQLKIRDNKKIVIILADDKIFRSLEKDSIWGKILKNALSPFTFLETAYGEGSDKIWVRSVIDKMRGFDIPLNSKNQKVIYQDDLFYIFELVNIIKQYD
jgi:hypothetical protein